MITDCAGNVTHLFWSSSLVHLSSFIPHPSSFIPHPSSGVLVVRHHSHVGWQRDLARFQPDFTEQLWLGGRYVSPGQIARQAWVPLAPLSAALLEHAGGVSILLVLQQPANQFLPRILQLIGDLLLARQD